MFWNICDKQSKNDQSSCLTRWQKALSEIIEILKKQRVLFFTYVEIVLITSALKLDCFLSYILRCISCCFCLEYLNTVNVSTLPALWNYKERKNSLGRLHSPPPHKKIYCHFTPIICKYFLTTGICFHSSRHTSLCMRRWLTLEVPPSLTHLPVI